MIPSSPAQTEQTTGDLIGRAFRVYRNNLHWAQKLVWPTLLVCLGKVFLESMPSLIGGREPFLWVIALTLCGLAITLSGKYILLLRQLSFVRLACGFSSQLDDSMQSIKSRQRSILVSLLLTMLIAFALGALWILEIVAATIIQKAAPIPGHTGIALGFAGLMLTLFFIYNCLNLSLVAASCDEGTAAGLARKGYQLASRTFFRTLFIGLMTSLSVAALSLPLWIPIGLLMGLDSLRLGHEVYNGGTYPFYWQVIMVAWESMLEMITWPVVLLSFGFYYYDLRLRYEGIDILTTLSLLDDRQSRGGVSRQNGTKGHIS